MNNKREEYVFGLDIGTRSIVGTVGFRMGTDRFVVVAQKSIEHKTRAVIDGQIHDITTVADEIATVKKRLEREIGQSLKHVSIAAAGRVLKTKTVHVEHELQSETRITKEHIHSLDSIAVEKAYELIQNDDDQREKHFYCVGYSPVKYFLNGYPMEMIEKHMASTIGVEMIATFLPDEVVDGLYQAVEEAGLHVASLTLEPIAAINVAIPERFRLLNIALVDVGAGTSDISVVKEGSVIAYGMMPLAGDEITEAIAQKYLTDFETAEKAKKDADKKKLVTFKDIMGETVKVSQEDIHKVAEQAVDPIVSNVAKKIIELNGDCPVSAVFVVGGGGKMPGFTEKLAKELGLPKNRVAIRGAEVLQQIDFSATDIKKDSTLVTPIGICLEYYEQKSSFIYVNVNEERVKIYDNGKATVLDACIHAGFSQESLFPSRGESVHYTVNGDERETKGYLGEPAEVVVNGKETSLNELVKEEDDVVIKPATKGESAHLTLGRIKECQRKIKIKWFGDILEYPVKAYVNGVQYETGYVIQEGDQIAIDETYKIEELFAYTGMVEREDLLLNGEKVPLTKRVTDGDEIKEMPAVKKSAQPIKPVEVSQGKSSTVVEDLVKEIQKEKEEPAEDPLLTVPKPLPAWAADLPFMTKNHMTQPQMMTAAVQPEQPQQAPVLTPPVVEVPKRIKVEINGTPTLLPEKARPVFVDLFDVYPIDLTKPGGKRMVSRLNGMDIVDFSMPLHEGDRVDLYWEK
ncbi:MAG: cell division protein FtsA [Eubacterium sp.]